MWSCNNQLYKASVLEADEKKKVCMVRYDEYDSDEERPWVMLCPVYDRRLSGGDRGRHFSGDDRARRLSGDDRYHRNRRSLGHRQVAISLSVTCLPVSLHSYVYLLVFAVKPLCLHGTYVHEANL